MGETDKFEHFVIMRHADGSLWELGRGAMGVTYKAFDTNLRSDVALKVINSQFLNSETARQRFLREARAAASLRHPNVATVFHLGNSEGGFYYAMEYVEGETVERRVQREGPLPPELALRITRQVSRALIAADRQKLVHRDIKPSNIMLVVDDEEDHLLVKVIDFRSGEVARCRSRSIADGIDGRICRYTAFRQPGATGRKGDRYSVGYLFARRDALVHAHRPPSISRFDDQCDQSTPEPSALVRCSCQTPSANCDAPGKNARQAGGGPISVSLGA